MTERATNGHQARTDDTKGRLLAAAEEVFVREGFENARLDVIAKAAGRTKGSIYGHFRSKDDLFLALYEHRSWREMSRLQDALSDCERKEDALQRLKEFLLELVSDKTWPLLTLEFKLYAVRHPESRERLSKAHELTRLVGNKIFHQRLYGPLKSSERKHLETAAAAIGPILSAMTLETYFEPSVLSEDRLKDLVSRLFEVLLQPTNLKTFI